MQCKDIIALLEFNYMNPIKYAIQYGSSDTESDIDLFVVYENTIYNPNIFIGLLDIIAIDEHEFRNSFLLHDIIVSEPLITGNLLKGDYDNWIKLKNDFLNRPPNSDSIFYLINKSFVAFSYAMSCMDNFTKSKSKMDYTLFWRNMSFSIAYFEFARKYKRKIFPFTFQELKSCSMFFHDTILNLKKIREREIEEFDISLMKDYIKKFRTYVFKIFK